MQRLDTPTPVPSLPELIRLVFVVVGSSGGGGSVSIILLSLGIDCSMHRDPSTSVELEMLLVVHPALSLCWVEPGCASSAC